MLGRTKKLFARLGVGVSDALRMPICAALNTFLCARSPPPETACPGLPLLSMATLKARIGHLHANKCLDTRFLPKSYAAALTRSSAGKATREPRRMRRRLS